MSVPEYSILNLSTFPLRSKSIILKRSGRREAFEFIEFIEPEFVAPEKYVFPTSEPLPTKAQLPTVVPLPKKLPVLEILPLPIRVQLAVRISTHTRAPEFVHEIFPVHVPLPVWGELVCESDPDP